MQATLGVPSTMVKPLSSFLAAEGLSLDVVTDADCTVRVEPGAEGEQSTATVLRAGGAIACGTAFHIAGKLGVKVHDLGKLLDHLDIKVRACQLGCFG